MRKTAIILSSLLLASAGAAFAGDSETAATMSELDENSDGQVSEEEAQANTTIAGNFEAADIDNSGSLTRSEFIRAIAASGGEEETAEEEE